MGVNEMGRHAPLIYVLAFLVFPSAIAAMSWTSGMAQVITVFLAMVVLDALILGLAHFVQGKRD
jgi:hypothetical protein